MQNEEQDLNRHLRMRRKPISGRAMCCGALVACVAFLAAIFVPVFRSARYKAHEVACESNVKQLSVALLLYMEDWDEHFPSARRWGSAVTKYLPHDADPRLVFRCPAATSVYGYALNRRLANVDLRQVEAPMDTVTIFEADGFNINTSGDLGIAPTRPRHYGGSIFGFIDGHAKWVRHTDAILRQLRWKP